MASENKRMLADIPADFFWEAKKEIAGLQLKQKTVLVVALREFIKSKYDLEKLVDDPEEIAKLKELGIQ